MTSEYCSFVIFLEIGGMLYELFIRVGFSSILVYWKESFRKTLLYTDSIMDKKVSVLFLMISSAYVFEEFMLLFNKLLFISSMLIVLESIFSPSYNESLPLNNGSFFNSLGEFLPIVGINSFFSFKITENFILYIYFLPCNPFPLFSF